MVVAMDGSSADGFESTTRDAWIRLLCHHFDSWGLNDVAMARAAAERVLGAVERRALDLGEADPIRVATRWIQSMADDGAGESSDWFFRAPALLSRFPAAFLETDVPDPAHVYSVEMELLPELSPRSMPEQEVIGPITHAVRVAAEAMEGVAAQQTGVETSFGAARDS